MYESGNSSSSAASRLPLFSSVHFHTFSLSPSHPPLSPPFTFLLHLLSSYPSSSSCSSCSSFCYSLHSSLLFFHLFLLIFLRLLVLLLLFLFLLLHFLFLLFLLSLLLIPSFLHRWTMSCFSVAVCTKLEGDPIGIHGHRRQHDDPIVIRCK